MSYSHLKHTYLTGLKGKRHVHIRSKFWFAESVTTRNLGRQIRGSIVRALKVFTDAAAMGKDYERV